MFHDTFIDTTGVSSSINFLAIFVELCPRKRKSYRTVTSGALGQPEAQKLLTIEDFSFNIYAATIPRKKLGTIRAS